MAGSAFSFEYKNGAFVFYKKNTNMSISKIDRLLMKYYEPAILYIENLSEIVKKQLKTALDGISHENIIMAYEPVWAISRGDPKHKAATPDDAKEMQIFVRKLIAEIYSDEVAENMLILYGGSMKPENVKELMALEDVDGGLVGGASLEVEKFANTVKFK